ncbi:MAG: hypothetical protein ACHQHN_11865 [Sphingobacteriales bacterium]
MKLTALIVILLAMTSISYAQTDVGEDTTAIGLEATSMNGAYKFLYQNHQIAHYGLGWYTDSDFSGGPFAYLGGYGGIKLFTGGAFDFI